MWRFLQKELTGSQRLKMRPVPHQGMVPETQSCRKSRKGSQDIGTMPTKETGQ